MFGVKGNREDVFIGKEVIQSRRRFVTLDRAIQRGDGIRRVGRGGGCLIFHFAGGKFNNRLIEREKIGTITVKETVPKLPNKSPYPFF